MSTQVPGYTAQDEVESNPYEDVLGPPGKRTLNLETAQERLKKKKRKKKVKREEGGSNNNS